jgi:hypothetical protein
MTARELIEKMEIENLERGLFYLGQYTGKGNYFLSFPDAEVEEIDEVDFDAYFGTRD